MAAAVHKRVSAQRDLVEDYVYLAEHAGIDTAERFLASADESSVILPAIPKWEAPCPWEIRS